MSEMQTSTIETLKISALDGYPLKTCVYSPEGITKAVILLAPGLGIPKEYYHDYCQFLAEEGYTTVIFDYRGIGKEDKGCKFEINLRNWGMLDIPGVLNWISESFPDRRIFLFGHSIGGQIAGLIPNYYLVDRFVFISTTGGHWSLFDFPLNILTIFMFYIHIPFTARLLGYMPPSLTYRGVGIARGVALEWAAISRKKGYISAYFGKTIKKEFYTEINQKIDWISFKDDLIATDQALSTMMDYYPNAEISHERIDPTNLGLGKIGHAGFFRSKAGPSLWRIPLDLIDNE